jgi:hypothetical protein
MSEPLRNHSRHRKIGFTKTQNQFSINMWWDWWHIIGLDLRCLLRFRRGSEICAIRSPRAPTRARYQSPRAPKFARSGASAPISHTSRSPWAPDIGARGSEICAIRSLRAPTRLVACNRLGFVMPAKVPTRLRSLRDPEPEGSNSCEIAEPEGSGSRKFRSLGSDITHELEPLGSGPRRFRSLGETLAGIANPSLLYATNPTTY